MMNRDPDQELPERRAPPRWINPALAIAALGALAAALAVLYAGWDRGPRHHGLIADITVNLDGQPVREHCTTCHVEGGRAQLADGAWSSSLHPDITPHAPERLGCTGCHLGEGMALDRIISHGLPGLGARRVLSGQEVQGRCYACHAVAPLAGAEEAWSGYRLYRRKACDLCHHLRGLEGGFGYGPTLSDIGSQLGIEQLAEAIREPAKEPPNSIMPRFPLSKSQARQIAYFLKSRTDNAPATSPMWMAAGRPGLPAVEMAPMGVELPPGKKLLWHGGCLACHRFGREDGRIAPDLSGIGAQRSRDYLEAFLTHPSRQIPGAIMPSSALTETERDTLAAFLSAAKGTPRRLPPRQTYMHYCQRCHAANGDGRGLIQPNLAQFPRAFTGNAAFFRRASDERLRDSIARGIPGTSMPPYERLIPQAGREELLDLIFQAFVGIDRYEK
ncbi:MAG: c-type cytochrome, partial [Desulfuromonadales bacterium]|nr:c-type cytochrome [Desulfuromonadales bacterium]NIS42440.1 c-type cytochrome [Desulfuromonadales bacterium]